MVNPKRVRVRSWISEGTRRVCHGPGSIGYVSAMAEPAQANAPIKVSAVALFNAEGQLLTVRKRGTDTFMLPGGKPEAGESARDCAVREISEEIGVDLRPDELIDLGEWITPAANEPDTDVHAAVYSYRPEIDVAEPRAEIEASRWIDPRGPVARDYAPLLIELLALLDPPAGLTLAEFGFPGGLRDRLVSAILSGKKTSTTGLLADYLVTGDPLPEIGQRSIVIDSAGLPLGIIEGTRVRTIALKNVDLQHVLDEGEDDRDVATWRAGHEEFFHCPQMRAALGDPEFTVDDDTLVVLEEFRLLRQPRRVNARTGESS